MKRRDRVLQALQALAQQYIQAHGVDFREGIHGFHTAEIAVRAGVVRTNCSAELNSLCRTGEVRKLAGRPTRYWPELASVSRVADDVVQQSARGDAFSRMIGSARSLQEVVRQAKIAVSYPPHGMHALILGQAGVGKSTLASAMHAYALERGMLANNAPFVPFNCAEYANNPEILMDHMFGHVKGAFTGAHQDKPGMIELANDGVLFLDEIHRLPPQGQEMLFHWLDSGQFRRMGEVEARRYSRALLVAATTEVEETALLLTFRRRIPVTIELPALHDWSLHDRYELIYQGVREEAETLGRVIRVSGPAVDKLLFAHFPGNIGGLRNALKLACARAWALDEAPERALQVEPQHVQLADNERITLVSSGGFSKSKEILVKPNDLALPANAAMFEESLYGHLARIGEQLQEIGLAHDEIVIALERELLRRQHKEQLEAPSQDELRRFVGEPFFSWLERSWATVAKQMDEPAAERAFIRVGMHLSGLTRDAQGRSLHVDESVFSHVRQEYPQLCAMAQTLLHAFARESGIALPAHEVPLVALLLKPSVDERVVRTGIVLVLRGDGISTQLALTVQQVSLSVNIVSINVPLGAGQGWIEEQTARALQLADSGLGLIFMTDVPAVRRWLRLHAPSVACMYRPDLTSVLETVMAIESGADMAHAAAVSNTGRGPTPIGRRQIWTCCLTGRGTALALKRLLDHALPADWIPQLEIIPLEVSPDGLLPQVPSDAVIVVVGSVRPKGLRVPFLSVEELLATSGMERLQNMISHSLVHADDAPIPVVTSEQSAEDVLRYVQTMLEQDVRFVNPTLLMRVADDSVLQLASMIGHPFTTEWRARFCLHMAYVTERAIMQTPLEHARSKVLRTEHASLWNHVEQALAPFVEHFSVTLTAGEVAYVVEMVYSAFDEGHEESGS